MFNITVAAYEDSLYVLKVLTPLLRVLRLVCAVRWSEKRDR